MPATKKPIKSVSQSPAFKRFFKKPPKAKTPKSVKKRIF